MGQDMKGWVRQPSAFRLNSHFPGTRLAHPRAATSLILQLYLLRRLRSGPKGPEIWACFQGVKTPCSLRNRHLHCTKLATERPGRLMPDQLPLCRHCASLPVVEVRWHIAVAYGVCGDLFPQGIDTSTDGLF
jgi:hypothetical protein